MLKKTILFAMLAVVCHAQTPDQTVKNKPKPKSIAQSISDAVGESASIVAIRRGANAHIYEAGFGGYSSKSSQVERVSGKNR